MLSFTVLGSVDVVHFGRSCGPTAPRALGTLALLLARANYVVPTSVLIEELWGENPPRSAAATAQTYIYHLRRLIDETCGHNGKELLVTRAPGYVLRVEDQAVDLLRFRRMAAQGQGFLDDDRPDLAGAVLRQALALWSGPPLANVSAGPILTGYITALEEERTRALNTRIEADLRVGRFRELIPELHRLIVEYPYDEWYYELLIFTLARVGRRHDALHTYLRARRLLADDLGLTPSRQLARMQEAILGNGELSPPTSQLHRQALDARTAS